MRRSIWLLMTILLFGALLGVACGGGDSDDDGDGMAMEDDNDVVSPIADTPPDAEAAIEMKEFSFGPKELTVTAGEVVEITISNSGTLLHDFSIEKIDTDVHITDVNGVADHSHDEAVAALDVHIALDANGEGLLKLKAHEAGTYTFFCSVAGHRQAGMEGTLTVE